MRRLLSLNAVTVSLAITLHAATNDYRVWHDAKGRSITAAMTSCQSGQVTLVRRDGVSSTISLTNLSLADNAYVQSIAGNGSGTTTRAVSSTNRTASFSLRPAYEKFGLDVRDQGRRGSCLVFGTLNPLEFHHAMRGENERLSERFTSWAANTLRGKIDGSEAYSPQELFTSIRTYGYTTEEVYRLKYKDHGSVGRPDKKALAEAAKHKNIEVQYFGGAQGLSAEQIQAMCSALASSNPVTLCLNWPEKVKFGSGKVIRPWKKAAGGHAVVAVGYVLDKNKPGGGMFELRNSWGDNWGDDGYAFITFDLLIHELTCAFTIKPGTQ